jgi:TPR repeat protein
VQLTGHETIDGEPVSIYTRVSKSETVTKEILRIADKDYRLLDRSGETKGELRVADKTIPENYFWHATYEYDPSIRIVLPPAVKSSPTPTPTPRPTPTPTPTPEARVDQLSQDELQAKAEAGDAEAQYLLGNRYYYGKGVAKDQTDGVKWYRKAAAQNYSKAQNKLGYCYESGEGVAKDLVEAVKWYRKAADLNDAGGQYNLGRCYYKGTGVPKDLVEGGKMASESRRPKPRNS